MTSDPSDRLVSPVFVVGSPRSGTTLMQNVLGRDPSVYRLGRESRFLWHRLNGQELTGVFPGRQRLAPAYLSELFRAEHPWSSQDQRRWALRCASQGTPAQYLDLPHDLLAELDSGETGPFADSSQAETAPFTLPPLAPTWASETDEPVRMVDKDTGHCWRLPDLRDAFPDARFIFVVRDPVDTVRSLVAGWRHPTWFFTYRTEVVLSIVGYSDVTPWGRHWWNFNLFPGWEALVDATLAHVCAQQWAAAMSPIVEHGLPLVDQGRAMVLSYERLVSDPHSTLRSVADFTGLDHRAIMGAGLDRSYMSMSPSTFDPGDEDIALNVDDVRHVMDPLADLLG